MEPAKHQAKVDCTLLPRNSRCDWFTSCLGWVTTGIVLRSPHSSAPYSGVYRELSLDIPGDICLAAISRRERVLDAKHSRYKFVVW